MQIEASRRRVEGHQKRGRLSLVDAAAARAKQTSPGEPVLLRVCLSHSVDQRRVLDPLGLADQCRPSLAPTLMNRGLPRRMRFAFQLFGEVVKKILPWSYMNQMGLLLLRSPLRRCVAT